MTLPQFLVVSVAEFLPRDQLVVLALTSKGCAILASQELHHRRRVKGNTPTNKLTNAVQQAMLQLPVPIGRILNRWHIHLSECVDMNVTPLNRRVSVPGMEWGTGSVTDPMAIEWGVTFPTHEGSPVHWLWKDQYGDGEADAICGFLGVGAMEDAMLGPLWCISVTAAQRMTTSVGGITYITFALLINANGDVTDISWSFVISASVVYALRSDNCENELVFSSHPTVFSHLHELMGHEAPVEGHTVVPRAHMRQFKVPLPARSNRTSFNSFRVLIEASEGHEEFSSMLHLNFLDPIARAMAHVDSELYSVKGLTRDLTTPKGVWKIETSDVDLTRVDVHELWNRRATKQLAMVAKASKPIRNVVQSGVIPLGTLLCMDIDRMDPLSSPSQIYLA